MHSSRRPNSYANQPIAFEKVKVQEKSYDLKEGKEKPNQIIIAVPDQTEKP